jgi:hypothetical protein
VLYPVIHTQETVLWPFAQIGDVQNMSQKCHPLRPYHAELSPSSHMSPIQLQAAPIRSRFNPVPVHVGFLLDKVALGQAYPPVSYSAIHQRRYVTLTQEIIFNYNIPTISYEAAVLTTQQECHPPISS